MPLWGIAARLHLSLWKRSVKAVGTLKRWFRLRAGGVPWDELADEQRALAVELSGIGDALVLPGDPDWVPPATGLDDDSVVCLRTEPSKA
tara:strand:- start:109 stop:378 length:270 start_codon:yes stop_codon:yes gene_type:complete